MEHTLEHRGWFRLMCRFIMAVALFPIDLLWFTGLLLCLTPWMLRCAITRLLGGGLTLPRAPLCRTFVEHADDGAELALCGLSRRLSNTWLLRMVCPGARRRPDGGWDHHASFCFVRRLGNLSWRRAIFVLLGILLFWGAITAGIWRWAATRAARHAEVGRSPAETFLAAANAQWEQGRIHTARIQFLNAVQADPRNLRAQQGVAQCALALKRHDEALHALRQIVNLAPQDADARIMLATLLIEQGDPAGAREHAEIAARLAPRIAGAQLALGNSARLLGDWATARAAADAALAITPAHPDALTLAGHVAVAEGDLDRARARFNDILTLSPTSLHARVQLARSLRLAGQPESARLQLDRVLTEQPNDPAAEYELAECEAQAGLLSNALARLTTAIERRPDNEGIRTRLATLALAAGRWDEAHTQGRELLTRHPGSPAGHLTLAAVYQVNGLYRAAEQECREALRQHPDLPAVPILMARTLILQNRHAEAITPLRKCVQTWPDDLTASLLLAECYLATHAYGDAQALLDATARKHPTAEAPLLLLARLHMERGDAGAAGARYRQVLAINPRQIVALNNLAGLLARKGRPGLDEALALATRAVELAPANPDLADTLGWIQAQRGDHAGALASLAFALRLKPDSPAIRHHTAEVLIALGRPGDAALHVQFVLEHHPAYEAAQRLRELRNLVNRHQGQ